MKKIVLFVIITLVGLSLFNQLIFGIDINKKENEDYPIQVSVDPRVELMSIIFHLAGHKEYNEGYIESYNKDVENHFSEYRRHPVVKLASKLRRKRGISYNAPMALAIHITDIIKLEERTPFNSNPIGLDKRWKINEAREFLEKARKFIKETDFDKFNKSHQPLYNEIKNRMKKVLITEVNLTWFDNFFGAKPGANFHVILAMVNGGSCYGVRIRIKDSEDLYCILGVWMFDEDGIPQFDKSVIPTVIHEFCHSYCNPLVDAHSTELEVVGKRIYLSVRKKMKRMAYGNWLSMMYESLVRASVVRYLMTNEGSEVVKKHVYQEISKGFLWMKELTELLGEYESHRDQYTTVNDFFPKIVNFFNEYEIK